MLEESNGRTRAQTTVNYTGFVPLDVPAVQEALRAEGLDGWLLYDFHGSNPIAARLAGTGGGGKMTTRRWFYLIPASGEPHALVHAIERHNLDGLPGRKTVYAGREELEAGLQRLVGGLAHVAMEYSADCAIPYISRVDAGTVGRRVQRPGALIAPGARIHARRRALCTIKDRALGHFDRPPAGGRGIRIQS
jgi:hypothetical protein